MGAGASFAMPNDLKALADKPLDGSDIKDLEKARAELIQWRTEATRILKEAHQRKPPGHKGSNIPRKAVAPTNTPVPNSFVKPFFEKNNNIKALISKAARENLLFRSCTDHDWADVVNAFHPTMAKAGDVIIRQGDEGDIFYIVEEGSLDVWIKAPGTIHPVKVGAPLGPGSAFGELALMYNTTRAATIKASSDCKLWIMDRYNFRAIKVTNQKYFSEEVMGFLSNVKIGTKMLGETFGRSDLQRIASLMERHQYVNGQHIITQGERGDHFFIVLEGEVIIYKTDAETDPQPGKKLGKLTVGQYFGEKALLSEDSRAATIMAESNVTCLSLGREDFIEAFGNLDEFLQAKSAKLTQTQGLVVATGAGREWLTATPHDFSEVCTLGRGAFGKVLFVKHRTNGQNYALKCQPKKRIVEAGLQQHLLNEVKVMQMLDHPMICRLHSSFQDDTYIYFALEPCMGGELFTHLRNLGNFQEAWARYYAACVTLALQCLHAHGIAYRDLKPENLVLDNKGNLKVVDFGLAKVLGDGKSYTLCGTPDYLAPEMILSEGHTVAVDFWALGILLYEMVSGMPPFYADDPMDTYERILGEDFLVPPNFSKNLVDLIAKLLKKQPNKRLGSAKGGASTIIKHKWFNSMDWESLIAGTIIPPSVPELKSQDDTAYFSAGHDHHDDEVQPYPGWNPDLSPK